MRRRVQRGADARLDILYRRDARPLERPGCWICKKRHANATWRSKRLAETTLTDDPETLRRLDSVACLLEWMRSMPESSRERFIGVLAACGDESRQVMVNLLAVVKDPRTTLFDRQNALTSIADALFSNREQRDDLGPDSESSPARTSAEHSALIHEVQGTGTQQAAFAARLRELMEARRISQQELADRVGCSQPAISQMLNRHRRPQKQTILKLAEALHVPARDLWPDIDVAEMLDAVASFQQQDDVMTDAEARALGDASRPNHPKIRAKSLPTRR